MENALSDKNIADFFYFQNTKLIEIRINLTARLTRIKDRSETESGNKS